MTFELTKQKRTKNYILLGKQMVKCIRNISRYICHKPMPKKRSGAEGSHQYQFLKFFNYLNMRATQQSLDLQYTKFLPQHAHSSFRFIRAWYAWQT